MLTEIMTPYGEKAIFPKEWFEEIIKVPFETMMISVPKNYDRILSQLYGDYMNPPPVDQQVSHHSCDVYIDAET